MMTSIKNIRTVLLPALLVLIAATASADDWLRIPLSTPHAVTGLSFPHPDTGFLVTHGGECGISYDGGNTWSLVPVEEGVPLEAVHFTNSQRGLVCGRGGALYRTVDGGRTWEDRSAADTSIDLVSIRIIDENRAVATGMQRKSSDSPHPGVLLTSQDSGQTWRRKQTSGVNFGNLFISGSGNVYFQSWGYLHFSRDRGETWQAVKTIDGKPGRVTFVSGATALLAGNFGMAAYSHDNGKTWQASIPDSTTHYTSVTMVGSDTAYMAGHKGIVEMSTDRGKTWQHDLPPEIFDIYELANAGNYLYAGGTQGTLIRKKVR